MNPNALLIEQAKVVTAVAPVVPSSTTPDYVSLKHFERCTIVICIKNATTVTGSAITVKQATAVAGTGEKALSFTKAYRNIDTAAAGGDVLTEFAVASDTFTTDATNSKDLLYVIEVDVSQMDYKNGFDCLRLGTGNGTATTVSAVYVLWPGKYQKVASPSAILD
jgi:hypothetical protein